MIVSMAVTQSEAVELEWLLDPGNENRNGLVPKFGNGNWNVII